MDRIDIARADTEFRDHVITEVRHEDDRLVLSADSWSLCVKSNDAPRVGDMCRFFGRGFGYPVRGVGLVVGGRVVKLFTYETAEEHEVSARREIEESKAKKRAGFVATRPQFDADVAALPAPLRERVEFFMKRPDWDWDFGPYEVFACKEAAAIAAALRTSDAVREFAKAPASAQKERVPSLKYDEHSGNTFGMACRLAMLLIDEPHLCAKFHGALCPLVGCDDYGCWASTDEAKIESLRRSETHA